MYVHIICTSDIYLQNAYLVNVCMYMLSIFIIFFCISFIEQILSVYICTCICVRMYNQYVNLLKLVLYRTYLLHTFIRMYVSTYFTSFHHVLFMQEKIKFHIKTIVSNIRTY